MSKQSGRQVPNSQTRAVRAGVESDAEHGAVIPPLYLSSNFAFEAVGQPRKYDYTRTGNPTRDALGEAIAELEGGAGATITCTGMAAITLAVSRLGPSDLLVAPVDCYGGSYRLFTRMAEQGRFRLKLIDQTDVAVLAEAMALNPTMVWVESPTNPLLRVVDIELVRKLADSCGSQVVVDNTFLSPALQRPLSLGADMVVHSTTKYINGHSDVVGGAVVSASEAQAESIAEWSNVLGVTGAPFDSFLTLRGLRTLHIRVRQHCENALAVASAIDGLPGVACVHYPGLVSHPGHALATRQQFGYGGILSLELEGGEAAAAAFVESLQHFSLAESLGGVESLACHPWSMTHAPLTPDARLEAGITPGLVRLSIGIEYEDDLVDDVTHAIELAQRVAIGGSRVAAL
jgi:cystathionine gamma-synthase